MTVDLTASCDACQPSAVFQVNKKLQLSSTNNATTLHIVSRGSWKILLRLMASLGLGTCLTMATATAASGPVTSSGAQPEWEQRIAVARGADIGSKTLKIPSSVDAAKPSVKSTLTTLRDSADPLKAVVPVVAAELQDLRAEIIRGIRVAPLSEVVASESSSDEGSIMTFGEMRVPRWIVDAILRASQETGVDPVYMMALADKESSFIPANKASTSSAEGLYQFITSTWFEVIRSFGAKHGFAAEAEAVQVVDGQLTVPDENMREHILGLRRNPYISALMAAEMKKRDRTMIESKLGREITRSEFYLSHFFGVHSARKFMSLLDEKPKQRASRLFPAAAKANKALFYAKSGRKTRQLTIAEVYEKIDEMIDMRLDRYEDVSALVVADVDL